MNFEKEFSSMLEAAKAASLNIMNYYKKGFNVEIKEDNSPVTEADKTTDALVKNILSKKFPNYSFLTEESIDNKERLKNDYVFIIDPIDGTEDFINGFNEFTCNIALCYKHEIVVGVVAVPAKNLIYYGIKGEGSYKIDLNTNEVSKIKVNDKTSNLTALRSRFHSCEEEEKLFEKYKDTITNVEKCGATCKACKIAEGSAEISYRLKRGTKEWDTAAFQIIVEEAGGYVLDLNKKRMTYNREDVYNGTYIILNNLKNWLL